jgi:hypothetical protein
MLSRHDASTSASKRRFPPASGALSKKRKESGGSETVPLRSCSIISLSVGIFLILSIFLFKKIAYFRKICKHYFMPAAGSSPYKSFLPKLLT